MLLPYTCTDTRPLEPSAQGLWSMTQTLVLIALLLTPLMFSHWARAANIETLVMPGPLVHGHAQYETQCTQCHGRFEDQPQRGLCLDCHQQIAQDIDNQQGFHGHEPLIDGECSQCHGEHQGRDADILGLNKALFDHHQTDFPLEGKHASADCRTCHAQKGRMPDDALTASEYRNNPEWVVHWRDAPTACFACHEQDDAHQQRLGEACDDCHSASSSQGWAAQTFNHDDTHFPLSGAHQDALCAACHPNQRYQQIPTDCASCHGGQDVHQGGYGRECQQCHNNQKWNEAPFKRPILTAGQFSHDATEFALSGVHAKTACLSCHAIGEPAQEEPTACADCHRSDDIHQGRNSNQCQSCHNTQAWSASDFDHDDDTDFPLWGAHTAASCNACHASGVQPDAEPRSCIDCHKTDDIHAGKLGDQCQDCHESSRWFQQVRFDHDLTGMPLYGMHALTDCQSCHTDGSYQAEDIQCVACHKQDDHHERTLGQQCESCHNPNGWHWWQFDHDETDFPLTGKHSGLTCRGCHQKPVDTTESISLSNRCASCHGQDDAHDGRLGLNCERCHNTDSFTSTFVESAGISQQLPSTLGTDAFVPLLSQSIRRSQQETSE